MECLGLTLYARISADWFHVKNNNPDSNVATTIEITTAIEIIISIVVENEFQT